MGTNKDIAEEILAKVQLVAEARIRPMMGEYILYIDEKVAGQINENELFIKVTDFGVSYAPELKTRSPYPGAKPAFVIPASNIHDQSWLREFLGNTVMQLPKSKKK